MKKVKSVSEISRLIKSLKRRGKVVGLVTGCFDVLHADHISLFQFAKKHMDILVIGINSDNSIKFSKGYDRPIFNLLQREYVLSELSSVDLIFPIKGKFKFGSMQAKKYHEELLQTLKPDVLVTGSFSDRFWRDKETWAKKIGARALIDRTKKTNSSTRIIQKLKSRY